MTCIVLENARIFDGMEADCPDGMSVLVEAGRIREVSDQHITASEAQRFNCEGRTLMPGLIDVHIHAYLSHMNYQSVNLAGDAYRTAYAAKMLGHALDCGFTTVRDIGGGDWSLAKAIEDKLIRAPRFFYSGKILSMTGGHGDARTMGEREHTQGYCSCGSMNVGAVIADGVDECLKAVREELRRGAHCIKIMGSGGIASPTDPIWMSQYREDEITAIVGECKQRRTYVSSHCHPLDAIRRSVEYGVRVIEHGTFIDDETAAYVAGSGCFVVPTMVAISTLVDHGSSFGLAPQSQEKARIALDNAMRGLESMRRANVKLGYGSDLIGEIYPYQCREFILRREVYQPIEILRQVTSIGADILMLSGELGCISSNALADLIVVDGDPLTDIELLAADGAKLSLIMRNGEVIKNRLS